MDMPMMLVGLIPHCRHTWQWRRHPWYYIHTPQWVCPSAMFLNWHIGKESPSWYLQAAHNYRTPVFVDCEEFPSSPGPSGRIVVPSTGRFILALRHTWGAALAPRQRCAVAADHSEHGMQPGNWTQKGPFMAGLLGYELDGYEQLQFLKGKYQDIFFLFKLITDISGWNSRDATHFNLNQGRNISNCI